MAASGNQIITSGRPELAGSCLSSLNSGTSPGGTRKRPVCSLCRRSWVAAFGKSVIIHFVHGATRRRGMINGDRFPVAKGG